MGQVSLCPEELVTKAASQEGGGRKECGMENELAGVRLELKSSG
jgi:hypothetical protein